MLLTERSNNRERARTADEDAHDLERRPLTLTLTHRAPYRCRESRASQEQANFLSLSGRFKRCAAQLFTTQMQHARGAVDVSFKQELFSPTLERLYARARSDAFLRDLSPRPHRRAALTTLFECEAIEDASSLRERSGDPLPLDRLQATSRLCVPPAGDQGLGPRERAAVTPR